MASSPLGRIARASCALLVQSVAGIICTTAQAASQVGYTYEFEAGLSLKHGLVTDSAWLDNDSLLTLEVSPSGAQVTRTSLDLPRREVFLSESFIAKHVCPSECSTRLRMSVSPAHKHLLFQWLDESGKPDWRILDVSQAPDMRLRKVRLPGDMLLGSALFSPDDGYLALAQDSTQEGSQISLLVVDLRSGEEVWRLSSQSIGFIHAMWWASGSLDGKHFNLTASLFDGQFQESPGLVRADLAKQTLEFTSDTGGLLLGADAVWGKAMAHRSTGGNAAYFLRPAIPGNEHLDDIPLSREPVALSLLPQPGLALVANRGGDNENELWLIDLFSGAKEQVDADCESFDTLASGNLLVRARRKNELRLYRLLKLGAGSAAAGTEETGIGQSSKKAMGGRKAD